MPKRKPRSDGERPKKRRGVRPAPADGPKLPDPRALEGMMHQLVTGMRGDADPDTPLAKAQALLYRAFEEPNEQRRVQLARDALAICPDCADAYVLLAEQEHSRKRSLELYEQGVAAGERSVGPKTFQEGVGHFWGILETRPYLRARLGLAHALWTLGRRDEAVTHLQDMLRLNPNDNQGVRYTLAGFLLFLDRDDDLARLLDQYPNEGTAAWTYTRALRAYRHQGDTLEARQLLKKAKKSNKHVLDYLLGRKQPPNSPPGYYRPGDESEALNYLGSFLVGWKNTSGAIAWLRENDQPSKKRKAAQPQGRGPLDLVKKWLREKLPQGDDVWQVDGRQFPQWIRQGGQLIRPWVILTTSLQEGLVLGHQMPAESPSAALLWDTLVQAMQYPKAGEPHRPAEIQVRADERWEALRSHLEAIGVRLVVQPELKQFDVVFRDMIEHVCGKPEPGLLDAPGVTPEQVGRCFEAAAGFFEQAPWKRVGYESAIRVECVKYQSGPWYAVLMGQSGLTMGVALYENLDTLKAMWGSVERDDEENARESVATTVTFGEETETPIPDVDAAKKYGWKVARPDAYPSIFHKDRGMSMRPPLAWELELVEGCLRAIPDFVNGRSQDDPTGETVTVTVASGPLKLGLSWVVDL